MLIKILVGVLVLVGVLAIVIAQRPSHFRVARSVTVSAPPEAVFPHVNGNRVWEPWSPWTKQDPSLKLVYEGPETGVGSASSWESEKSGVGRSTIVESRPSNLIRFRLDMLKPMKATNDVEFTFVPQGDQTVVTWAMSGENYFVGKAFGLFVDCDKMIGDSFQRGLDDLKALVEKSGRKNVALAP